MKNYSEKITFQFAGYGRYNVRYTTGRGDYYIAHVTDMQLIDDTKNAEEPTAEAWKRLIRAVKYYGTHFAKNGEKLF